MIKLYKIIKKKSFFLFESVAALHGLLATGLNHIYLFTEVCLSAI
jgi:hypothetical protein